MFETLQLIFYVVAILSGLLAIISFALNMITNNGKIQSKAKKHSKKKYHGPYKKKRTWCVHERNVISLLKSNK